MRREIVFSARDNGVTSFMDKMKRSSIDVGRGILQDSMEQSKSAKEAIQSYERQISLIEKRNRIERDASKLEAEQARDRQMSSARSERDRDEIKSSYQSTIKGINEASREDKIQVDLLRELIQTVKSTSEQEIRAGSDDSKRDSDELRSYLDGEDDSEFRSVADQLREEKELREKGPESKGSKNYVAGAASVAQSGEGTTAVQKTLDAIGKGPILGTIAGVLAIAVAGLTVRAQRERSAEKLAGISGISNRSIVDSEIGATDFFDGYGPNTLGVSREDFLSKVLPSTIRAGGTLDRSARRAMENLELEKALGLNEGTADSMTRLGRASGDLSSQRMMNHIYSSLYGTGAFGKDNQDMSRMQDIVDGLTNFGESEFSRAGVQSGMGTLQTRRGLEMLGGRFKRDDYAMQTIQGINSGISAEGTPEARAMKFDVLRQLNPDKNFFELQTEMDQGINSEGYLQGILDLVRGTGGDENAQSILLDSLTGGQMRKKDITSIIRGDMQLEDYDSESNRINYKDRATNSVSKANEQLLNFTEQFKDVMSVVGGGVESAISLLQGIEKSMNVVADAYR